MSRRHEWSEEKYLGFYPVAFIGGFSSTLLKTGLLAVSIRRRKEESLRLMSRRDEPSEGKLPLEALSRRLNYQAPGRCG
jgi:hypothetical protein